MGFSSPGQGLFLRRWNRNIHQPLKSILLWMVVLGFIGGGSVLTGMGQTAWAQVEGNSGTSNSSSLLPSGPVPFAGYEERLRQTSRWQQMSDEEREQAIQKIQSLRQKFLRSQQEIQAQYKSLLEKPQKRRESLMKKRRRAQQYDEINHWDQFQALPIQKRLEMEKTLGLSRVPPSQRRKTFSKNLERLPYSRKQKVLKEMEGKIR